MTAAERQRLRQAVSDARRAAARPLTSHIRPEAVPELAPLTETERDRRLAVARAYKARMRSIVETLDDWQWEAA